MKAPVSVEQVVVEPPEGTDRQKAADAIVGSIMASAVFDTSFGNNEHNMVSASLQLIQCCTC